MSTRTHLISLKSLVPIQNAIASLDQSLVDAVVTRRAKQIGDTDDEEYRNFASNMIMCAKPPKSEPGFWIHVIEILAEHFNLKPRRLVFDDWKHHLCWPIYLKLVSKRLSSKSRQHLKQIVRGRPLIGLKVRDDGCVYAWLTPTEATELLGALDKILPTDISDKNLVQFHNEFVAALKQVSKRSDMLFVGAH